MKSRVLDHKPELEKIINNCDVCHIAMVDENKKPYVLPFNFGYKDGEIILHSAQQGKKINILKTTTMCV